MRVLNTRVQKILCFYNEITCKLTQLEENIAYIITLLCVISTTQRSLLILIIVACTIYCNTVV